MEKLAYSTKEAAEAAGIGKTTLFAALAAGVLKSRKVGRKRVILREDLMAWLLGLPA